MVGRPPGSTGPDTLVPYAALVRGSGFTSAGSKDAAAPLSGRAGTRAVQADSADRAAVAKTIAAEGLLDILVVNAGIAVFGDPLEIDPTEVDRLIDVNVRGPYHAAVEAARAMPEGGRIIVIGSVNGDRVPFAGMTAYSLSKSAIQGLEIGRAHV